MHRLHISVMALAALAGLAATPRPAQAQYWREYGGYGPRPFARFYPYARARPFYAPPSPFYARGSFYAPPPIVYAPPPIEYAEPPAIVVAPPEYHTVYRSYSRAVYRPIYHVPVVHRAVVPTRPAQPVSCTCPVASPAVTPAVAAPTLPVAPIPPGLPALRPAPAPAHDVYPPETP